MAKILKDVSRTFNEFLLLPNLTDERCIPSNVSLKTPLVKFKKGEEPKYYENIPFVSAIMQAVSGEKMAIALAREGGCSFIFGSQSIESQAEMVRRVKKHKAGFIDSDSNVKSGTPLKEVIELVERTGHSTVTITEDGTSNGKFLGLVTDKDYRVSRVDLEEPIDKFMTPREKIVCAKKGISLAEANDIIWENKISCLPILDENDNLEHLVFRKDYEERKNNPESLLDENKRYIVGAGINTRDYEERIPALVEAGVDLICMDSSDGYSVWQKNTIEWVRKHYGDDVKIGAGNVVDKEGFYYLAEAGAGPCVQPAAGYQPDKDSAQPYHLQRGGVRALCDAGAFPERRGHVLRHQRKIPQHDHAGPQAGPMSQRLEAGHPRQRQIHELQV